MQKRPTKRAGKLPYFIRWDSDVSSARARLKNTELQLFITAIYFTADSTDKEKKYV